MNPGANDPSATDLSAIEEAFNAKVPAQLVDFIIQYKDQTVNKKFDRIVNDNFTEEMQLWTVMSAGRIKEAHANISPDPDMERLKLVPFGETPGSPVICMSLHEDTYGSIYVLDWDFGPTKVADSLNGFLSMLEE